MSEKDKPKGADSGNSQRGASEIAAAFEGDGLCLCERRIQSAVIISQGPKDESAAAETFCSGAL